MTLSETDLLYLLPILRRAIKQDEFLLMTDPHFKACFACRDAFARQAGKTAALFARQAGKTAALFAKVKEFTP